MTTDTDALATVREKLGDLLVQATKERSHFYVGSVVRETLAALDSLAAELEREKERATENGRLAQKHWDELERVKRERDHFMAHAERLDADLERVKAERDVLFKGDWAALNLRVEMAEARLDKALSALREADGVVGGVIWLNNNIHNYGSDGWREFFFAVLRDARRARVLAAEIEGAAT